ncbi:MAG: VOC family protein [Alphaproteobacteria bacterium]|nr:VOC family protein [Alphaproteobacteria bacterium]
MSDKTPRLYAARIFVSDYARARDFYARTLGLPVAFEMAEAGVLGVDAGGPLLIVERTDADGEDGALIGRFCGLSLQVADIHATYRRLLGQAVAFEGPPTRQDWGGVLAHFHDPDGNILTLLGE